MDILLVHPNVLECARLTDEIRTAAEDIDTVHTACSWADVASITASVRRSFDVAIVETSNGGAETIARIRSDELARFITALSADGSNGDAGKVSAREETEGGPSIDGISLLRSTWRRELLHRLVKYRQILREEEEAVDRAFADIPF